MEALATKLNGAPLRLGGHECQLRHVFDAAGAPLAKDHGSNAGGMGDTPTHPVAAEPKAGVPLRCGEFDPPCPMLSSVVEPLTALQEFEARLRYATEL